MKKGLWITGVISVILIFSGIYMQIKPDKDERVLYVDTTEYPETEVNYNLVNGLDRDRTEDSNFQILFHEEEANIVYQRIRDSFITESGVKYPENYCGIWIEYGTSIDKCIVAITDINDELARNYYINIVGEYAEYLEFIELKYSHNYMQCVVSEIYDIADKNSGVWEIIKVNCEIDEKKQEINVSAILKCTSKFQSAVEELGFDIKINFELSGISYAF